MFNSDTVWQQQKQRGSNVGPGGRFNPLGSRGSWTVHIGGGFKGKILDFWLRWGMMEQRMGNYKGSEFLYLGGCRSHRHGGHCMGPAWQVANSLAQKQGWAFLLEANSPLPVELSQPPPGLVTFQSILRLSPASLS